MGRTAGNSHRQALLALALITLSSPLTVPHANALVLPSRRTSRRQHGPSSLSMMRRTSEETQLASSASAFSSSPVSRTRKRDLIRPSSWGGVRAAVSSRRRWMPLRASSSNDDESEKNAKNEDDSSSTEEPTLSLELIKEKWNTTVAKGQKVFDSVISVIPAPLVQFVSTILQKLFSWKWQFLSFGAGVILSIAAIVVPIYSQVETLSRPVTLFETILGDLDQAYVDPVDTDKLFETGVSAMLRSLDPYTEFESAQDAQDLTESIDGRYAGVGLVIAGTPASAQTSSSSSGSKIMPKAAQEEAKQLQEGGSPAAIDDNMSTSNTVEEVEELDDFEIQQKQEIAKAQKQGIRVINAFEGYAFDYGLRVGDKLVAVDDFDITQEGTTVEEVRNHLRGEPGTLVSISFQREGVDGVQTVTMPRTVVRIRDVKLAIMVGNPVDGIGYIQLTGFASDAGREMRAAIQYLQRTTEDATNGERSLQGLILDMRGNPGGLLTSAVDVASLIVPKGSDIVSAKGRGFPGILYRSRVDPLLDANTKLAVLVNGNTASAAEIVSGAIQDLDVGVIVGSDRTFGKGLVQNVEELPFNAALKFTVAKYYTPSGRCIQGINYSEGGGRNEEDQKYIANKVAEKDKSVFYTRLGRPVRDGGGIEADFKVVNPKASALEVTLLRSGLLADYAAEWSRGHSLTNNFRVDDEMYKDFQNYVTQKQRSGDVKLEALYGKPLSDLKSSLKKSGYKGSEKVLENLQKSIIRDIERDFAKYSSDIKEDISQSILARYLPESMLIERGLKTDKQVQAAVQLVANTPQFDKLLAKSSTEERASSDAESSSVVAAKAEKDRLSGKVNW